MNGRGDAQEEEHKEEEEQFWFAQSSENGKLRN